MDQGAGLRPRGGSDQWDRRASYNGYIYYVWGYRDADSVILKNVYCANTTYPNALPA